MRKRDHAGQLSIRHVRVFYRNEYTYPQSFSASGNPTILVFFVRNVLAKFRRGPLNTGFRRTWCMKKSRFSTNISLYLGNDERQGRSYCGTPIETRMRSIEWCHFE